jgi:acetyl esterase/lipase
MNISKKLPMFNVQLSFVIRGGGRSNIQSHSIDRRYSSRYDDPEQRMLRTVAAATLMLVLCAAKSNAEVVAKSGTFSGIKVDYKVVPPNGYDPAKAYPAILAFAGGGQEMRIVDGAIKDHFKSEAERRGYIVIIPAAPNGQLSFEGGDRIFPAFLDQMLRNYKVETGRFHIAGRSNGGLSAFHIAALYPKYFRSLTGFPGLLQPATNARIEALRPLCIYMHVGENDSGWRQPVKDQSEMLRQKGFKVHFTIEPGQEHSLETLAGAGSKRLFDQIEEAARTCK